jgi:CheY-like chemotaxis protein
VGLALVRALVAMHGGTVTARSEGVERGSTFTVTLPSIDAPAPAPPATTAGGPASVRDKATRPLSVFVVDDNEDAAQTLGVLLRECGHHVDVYTDPRSALEQARSGMPDVFVLDIGMPHIDGYELARRIRATATERRPLLVALTGYGHASDKERAQLAGFDHHMVKPLDPEALFAVLHRFAPHPP